MRESLRLENVDGSLRRWNEQVARSDGSGGGGASNAAASPSFLVLNKDNVNGQLYWAQNLATLQMERVLEEGGCTVEHGY